MYCKHCYRMISDNADICPACGKSQSDRVKKELSKGVRILLGIATWFGVMIVIAAVGTALNLDASEGIASTLYSLFVAIFPVAVAFKVVAPKKVKTNGTAKESNARTTPKQVHPKVDTVTREPNKAFASTIHPQPTPKRTHPEAHTLPAFTADLIRQCRKSFVAFDVETTGFSAATDKIIEISAVRFENFEIKDTFSSLINPHTPIPPEASRVNRIYDLDVKTAPDLETVIPKFCEFLGEDVLNGSVELVAHNAVFDINFLLHALSHCGIEADLSFQDTLTMCQKASLPIENNKLGTVAKHFGIEQMQGHRAEDDARVCGEIFKELLIQKEDRLRRMLSELNDDEVLICKWLKAIVDDAGLNTQFMGFHAGTYLTWRCVCDVAKFKTRARVPYVLVKKDYPLPEGLETAATSKAEGEKFIRVLYRNVSDLEPLKEYFIGRYRDTFDSAEGYFGASDKNMKDACAQASSQISV